MMKCQLSSEFPSILQIKAPRGGLQFVIILYIKHKIPENITVCFGFIKSLFKISQNMFILLFVEIIHVAERIAFNN